MKSRVATLALLAAGLVGAATVLAQTKVDPKLPVYKETTGVSGKIKSTGSDTMNNEMTLWSEGFLQFYPAVQAEIEGKGSTTAPPALIAGTADFGPTLSRSSTAMARPLWKRASTCSRSTFTRITRSRG